MPGGPGCPTDRSAGRTGMPDGPERWTDQGTWRTGAPDGPARWANRDARRTGALNGPERWTDRDAGWTGTWGVQRRRAYGDVGDVGDAVSGARGCGAAYYGWAESPGRRARAARSRGMTTLDVEVVRVFADAEGGFG